MKFPYQSRLLLPLLALSLWLPTQTSDACASESAMAAADTAWIRGFAASGAVSKLATLGRGNELLWNPRFAALLKISFPQKQWFWYDHYRLTPTADVIQTFLGVIGDAILDDNRYVTVNGCVPHVCDALYGMLWIDTSDHPALLFAGTQIVGSNSGEEPFHLWLFTSTKLDWTHLPAPFLASLQRWSANIGPNGNHLNFVLATLVQPNGVMEDISPAVLHLGATETGVKQ